VSPPFFVVSVFDPEPQPATSKAKAERKNTAVLILDVIGKSP
jgi:hypothetical protein